jgi:alpha-1,2-mannosyltransferase
MMRAIGGPWRVLWFVAVVWVVVYGFRAARRASRSGDEMRGIAIVGLMSALISPISWIHHLVWVVPALGVVVGDGRDRRRLGVAFAFAALFVLRLPYVGAEELRTGPLAELLKDSYGLLCLALLIYLSRGRSSSGRIPTSQGV